MKHNRISFDLTTRDVALALALAERDTGPLVSAGGGKWSWEADGKVRGPLPRRAAVQCRNQFMFNCALRMLGLPVRVYAGGGWKGAVCEIAAAERARRAAKQSLNPA